MTRPAPRPSRPAASPCRCCAVRSSPRLQDYQGNQQVLDQILVSPSIRRGCDFEYDSVHINSEFNDHDPQVLRFEP
ncbi:hypothetical protein ABZY09_15295 [Streptomyces sp. NPDC002928]|uniref:hypothetical protein n=1 Tax=Streptomyces sp. NPDC002928 TaxID=3154440 RepID=UPI0033A5DB64